MSVLISTRSTRGEMPSVGDFPLTTTSSWPFAVRSWQMAPAITWLSRSIRMVTVLSLDGTCGLLAAIKQRATRMK